MYQDDLKYTKTHEWIRIFKNRIARVGVTDHAQQRLGKVLFVELPEVDSEHEQFDSFVVIEAEDMVSEVYAPISGKIIRVNEELDEDPTIINHDPLEDGWILEIDIANEDEVSGLMDHEAYQRYLEEGGTDE